MHKGEPAVGANLPAPHSKHAAAEALPVSGLEVPAAQEMHAVELLLPVLGLYLPCVMARRCGGERLRRKGVGAGCCAGSERATTRRAC